MPNERVSQGLSDEEIAPVAYMFHLRRVLREELGDTEGARIRRERGEQWVTGQNWDHARQILESPIPTRDASLLQLKQDIIQLQAGIPLQQDMEMNAHVEETYLNSMKSTA